MRKIEIPTEVTYFVLTPYAGEEGGFNEQRTLIGMYIFSNTNYDCCCRTARRV